MSEADVERPVGRWADLAKARREFVCDECGRVPNCPMIASELWEGLGLDRRGLLCVSCFELNHLRRETTVADLESCVANDWTVLTLKRLVPNADVTTYRGYNRVGRALGYL